MAVMKMLALTLVGPRSEMEAAATRLLVTENFEPISLEHLVNDRNIRAKLITEPDNPYDALLSQLKAIWKVAGETEPKANISAVSADFTLSKAQFYVDRLTEKLDLWKKLRDSLKETGFDPTDLPNSEFLSTHFGRMSADNYQRLIDNDKITFVANKMLEHDGKVWFLLLAPANRKAEVTRLLDALHFDEYSTLYSKNSAKEISKTELMAMLVQQIDLHTRSIDGLANSARELLNSKRKLLENLFSQIAAMQRIYELCQKRGEIDGIYTISGWIPEQRLNNICAELAKCAPNSSVITEETKQLDITVPTLLKNCKLFAPFQDIVAMYSLPAYGEIDPSPLVALTFTLFFGFMFGDVGHGLIILLAAFYAQKKGIMQRSLAFVLKCAAISSILFGILYGSVFGHEGIIPPLWLLPMESTSTLISVAIVIGFATISLGMLLNGIQQYRAKNYGAMLFDGQGIAGLALYWTLTALLMLYGTGHSALAIVPLLWGGVVALVLVMIFKGVLAKLLLKEKETGSAAMNIFGVFEALISFLSNTASFVRLAAFALNHVGLSMAVIALSDMLANLPGGIFLKGLMLIAGNLLIAGLEGMIVFIQTLRLEYYEFFGKFFKGGGQSFKPVKIEE